MIDVTNPRRTAIVGAGRLGTALARRLEHAGHQVVGPLSREHSSAQLTGIDTILLCVPDREISAAAAAVSDCLWSDPGRTGPPSEPGRVGYPFVGHCSGAGTLDLLTGIPHAERFSLHPLMTFAGVGEPNWDAAAAVAGESGPALARAETLARELGLNPIAIAEEDRAAYHAAASIASNFLITLELAAERLAATAGCDREALLPLVRATVANWAQTGPAALTGPIARGDTPTVERQRAAICERTPELLGLFDALADATRELAAEPVAA